MTKVNESAESPRLWRLAESVPALLAARERVNGSAASRLLAACAEFVSAGLTANTVAKIGGFAVRTRRGKQVAPGAFGLVFRLAVLIRKAEDRGVPQELQESLRGLASQPLRDIAEWLRQARPELVAFGLAREGKAEGPERKARALVAKIVKAIRKAEAGSEQLPAFNVRQAIAAALDGLPVLIEWERPQPEKAAA